MTMLYTMHIKLIKPFLLNRLISVTQHFTYTGVKQAVVIIKQAVVIIKQAVMIIRLRVSDDHLSLFDTCICEMLGNRDQPTS